MLIWRAVRLLRQPRGTRTAPREYPLAASQERRDCRRSRGCRPTRARTWPICARKEDELLNSYGWVDRNAGVVRIPIDAGDEADARARPAGAHGEPVTAKRHRGRKDTKVRRCPRGVSALVSLVSLVLGPPQAAHAQMAGGPPAPATSGSRASSSSALPAPLREIGFDQNLDQRVPLDTTFRDEAGRDRAARRLLRQAGRSSSCSPTTTARCCARRCSTAWRARSACCRSSPGKDFEIVTVSFDPRDTPATAAAKKAAYLERYQRPGAAAAWHFLTGDQPSDRSADQGRRLPLRLGRGDEAVRAPDAASSCSRRTAASRSTSSASSTARAICGSRWSRRRPARSARRSTRCCSTAITTTR